MVRRMILFGDAEASEARNAKRKRAQTVPQGGSRKQYRNEDGSAKAAVAGGARHVLHESCSSLLTTVRHAS